MRIYYFATAHSLIIYLLQIDQLFQQCKSSKYFITVHRKIVSQLQIAYLEIIQRFISLLRTAQFFGYCPSYNYIPNTQLPIICLMQIDQLFQHWKSPKYLVTVHRKIVSHLQIDYLEIFVRFIWLMSIAQFFLLLSIIQLFSYCASTNYLSTANRPIISPLEIV